MFPKYVAIRSGVQAGRAEAFSTVIGEKSEINKVKAKTLAILLDGFLKNVEGINRERLLVMCCTLKLCSRINFSFLHF